MGIKQLIVGTALFCIFAIAIVSYAVGFASDNTVYTDIAEDTELSTFNTQAKTNLGTSFSTSVNSSSKAFQDSEILASEETTKTGAVQKSAVGSVFALKSTMQLAVDTITNKIFGGAGSEFAIVTTIFISIFVVIVGLYLWKNWKGDPD